MDTAIHGRFTWTEDELAAFARAMSPDRRSPRQRRQSRVLYFAGIEFLVLFAYAYLQPQSWLGLTLFALAALAFSLAWFLWIPLFLRYSYRKTIRAMSDEVRDVRWYVSGEGIILGDPMKGRTPWEQVIGEEETDRGFLLKTGEMIGIWLPKSSFDDPRDIERFRLLVKERKALAEKAAMKESLDEV
jgi:hypothetical protein